MFFRRRIDLAQQPFSRGSACLGRKNCTCLHVILQRTRSVSNCPAAGVPCLIGLNLVGSPMTKELFQICTKLMPKYFGFSVGKNFIFTRGWHENPSLPRTDGFRQPAACERTILQYKYQDKAVVAFGLRTGDGDSHATQSRFQITIGREKSGTKSDGDARRRFMTESRL